MKFAFVEAQKAAYTISFMCQQLGVSRSGFYAWRSRAECTHKVQDRVLSVSISSIFREARETYGSPRIHQELRARGARVSRHRVARLMHELGLRSRRRRKFVRTTDSSHGLAVAPNVLARQFVQAHPDVVWAADITYIPTGEGWLFLAVVLDLFSRRVIGWATSSKVTCDLAAAALRQALENRSPDAGVIHHSDRGSQYASREYQAALGERDMLCSMSRSGNCWDNAPVESFFATLKTELIHHRNFQTRREATEALFDYIEVFYNRRRRHSALGFRTPAEFDAGHFSAVRAA